MVPFAKTGGLADVCGALPKALKNIGHDVRVIMPKYGSIYNEKYNLKLIKSDLKIQIGSQIVIAQIYEAKISNPEIIVYFVGNDKYFDRKEFYQENGKDYPDNAERFVFFSKAALAFIKSIGWEPHVIQGNDWQSALAIAYIKTIYKKDPFFAPIACVYSIHNMGYLGLFPKEKMPLTGLGWEYFKIDGLEFYDQVSFAKAGIVFADAISTVSETYAKEIQTEEYGHGLDGLMKKRSNDIFGIMNGIDYDFWNPETDPQISFNYNPKDLKGKANDKLSLQKKHGLENNKDVPLIGMISRITAQKGFDILLGAIEKIMSSGAQFIILGAGDPEIQNKLLSFEKKYKGRISVNLGFDAALAEMIYAGSDIFLMPSKYEPCGLGQLVSFKYGTVPIVRATGGLSDSVKNYNVTNEQGDGFVFKDYNTQALAEAVERAVLVFKNKNKWDKLIKKVMKYNFSWDIAAEKYIKLYKAAIQKLVLDMKAKKAQKGR